MKTRLTPKQKELLNEIAFKGARVVTDIPPDIIKRIEQYHMYETLYLDIHNYLDKRWEQRNITGM